MVLDLPKTKGPPTTEGLPKGTEPTDGAGPTESEGAELTEVAACRTQPPPVTVGSPTTFGR